MSTLHSRSITLLCVWIRSAITVHSEIHSCCTRNTPSCFRINWFFLLQALKVIWNYAIQGHVYLFFNLSAWKPSCISKTHGWNSWTLVFCFWLNNYRFCQYWWHQIWKKGCFTFLNLFLSLLFLYGHSFQMFVFTVFFHTTQYCDMFHFRLIQ